jgi:hypothetical protein
MEEATEQDTKLVEQIHAHTTAPQPDLANHDVARPALNPEALAAQLRGRRFALALMVGSSLLMIVLLSLAWRFVRGLL